MDIELPSKQIQQKYVNVYNTLLENQKYYEAGLDDLKLVCDSCIENLTKTIDLEPIEKYVIRKDEKNGENGTKNVMG